VSRRVHSNVNRQNLVEDLVTQPTLAAMAKKHQVTYQTLRKLSRA
jgi:hypothetical protein